MKTFAVSIAALFIWTACGDGNQPIIDREALVERNSPVVTAFDSLASLSVGNGEFAYTVDITGLQTFPDNYKKGVPLDKLLYSYYSCSDVLFPRIMPRRLR